jgi:hypothetical protein
MPKINQYEANVRYLFRHSLEEIAAYARGRMARGRAAMVLFVRPDGRVRLMRSEMLEDDTGRGVVGYFTRSHDVPHIVDKLNHFIETNQEYLQPAHQN